MYVNEFINYDRNLKKNFICKAFSIKTNQSSMWIYSKILHWREQVWDKTHRPKNYCNQYFLSFSGRTEWYHGKFIKLQFKYFLFQSKSSMLLCFQTYSYLFNMTDDYCKNQKSGNKNVLTMLEDSFNLLLPEVLQTCPVKVYSK